MHIEEKALAAQKAFEILKNRFNVPFTLGIGSGSTSEIFLSLLLKHHHELPPFQCVASSKKIYDMSHKTLSYIEDESFEELDIYIDGADEVALDDDYHLIKGGGGCLTREKILYNASKLRLILVDASKLSRGPLGSTFKKIPVEILHFGSRATIRKIPHKGTIRKNFTTDQGALIFDIEAPLNMSSSTSDACDRIRKLAGVIEVGVFPPPHFLIIGKKTHVEVIHVS